MPTSKSSITSIDILSGIESLSSDDHILLNETIKHIFKSKKTTVITGAGISCNAGIPDFRSTDGLYNMIKHKHPKAIVRGQDLFDINLFRDNLSLSIFCTFMESLYKSTLSAKPTETHKFLKHLKDKGKLLRCYTQNIDSLEKNVNLNLGIEISKFENNNNNNNQNQISNITTNKNQRFKENWNSLDVVQLHGNLHKLSCTQCFANFNWSNEYQSQFNQGLNPECSNCYAKYEERLYSGKRITGNIGILRPDIVLYGENHPQSEILSLGLSNDLKLKPDLLIIMGTSLKVDGVKKLVKSLANEIHKKPNGKVLFINKTSLGKQWQNFIDYEILCDCDEFIKLLKNEIPDLFLTQEQIDSKKLKNGAKEYIKPIKKAKKSIIIDPSESLIKQESKIKQEDFITESNPMVKVENTCVKQEEEEDDVVFIKEEILTPPITPTKLQNKTTTQYNNQQQKPQPKLVRKRKLNNSNEHESISDKQENESDVENRARKLRNSSPNNSLRTPNNSFDDSTTISGGTNKLDTVSNSNSKNPKKRLNLLSKLTNPVTTTTTQTSSETSSGTIETENHSFTNNKPKSNLLIASTSLPSLSQTLQNIQNLPQDFKRKRNQRMESVSNLLGNILSIEDDESKSNTTSGSLKNSHSNQSLNQQLQSTPTKKRRSLDLDFSSFWKDSDNKNVDATTTNTKVDQQKNNSTGSSPNSDHLATSSTSTSNPNYYADKLMEKAISMIIPNEIYDDQTSKMLQDRTTMAKLRLPLSFAIMQKNSNMLHQRNSDTYIFFNQILKYVNWMDPYYTIGITLIITHLILKPILFTCLPLISLILNTLIPHYLIIYPPDPTFLEEYVEINPIPSTTPLELYKIPKPVPLFSKEFFMNLTDTQNFMNLQISTFDFMVWLTTDYLYFKNEKISSFIVLAFLTTIILNLYFLPSIIYFIVVEHSWILKLLLIFKVWIFIILMHPKIRSQLLDKVYDENTRLDIQNYVNKVENQLTSILIDDDKYNLKKRTMKEDTKQIDLSSDNIKLIEIYELQKLNPKTKIWTSVGFSDQFYTTNTVIRRYNNAIKQLQEDNPLVEDEESLLGEKGIDNPNQKHDLMSINKCENLKEIKPPIGYKFLPNSKWHIDFDISSWVEHNLIQDLVLIDDDEKWAYDVVLTTDEKENNDNDDDDENVNDDEINEKLKIGGYEEEKLKTQTKVYSNNNSKDNAKIINDDEIYRRRRWIRYVIRESYKDKKQIPIQQSHLASWVT
ncbi:HST3 [Candida pseudojiufengensis]|uniref:HST3 n=1 Tax=Candida pseudojiufengensis TaxID=497109 RepID=UPI0022244EDA|nr:HST3 [Candida pseudojiufengensis]KAI5964118.1 HST3 [Candida pseudojiufengensis]